MRYLRYTRSLFSREIRYHRKPVYSSPFLRWSSTTQPSLPTLPISPTSQHHDLASFLAYAARTTLSRTSTTYVGTHYEYTVQQSLRSYAFSLARIGGRADSGIDLVGTWHLPDRPHPLRVIIQCKAFRKKLGPSLIRELEGSFANAPVGWRGEGILGILVSTREATKGVRDALSKSRFPLIWIMADAEEGAVRQVLWNGTASDMGLEGLHVQIKHSVDSEEGVHQKIALTWDGEELKATETTELV